MMGTQHLVTPMFAGLLLALPLSFLGEVTTPNPYIEVHALEFDTGGGLPHVTQIRTVQATGPVLVAKWEAKVFTIEGTELVEACSGSGGWDYQSGFMAARIPFDTWVGEKGCFDSLPNSAKVRLYARYTWGDGVAREKWSERIIVSKSFLQ